MRDVEVSVLGALRVRVGGVDVRVGGPRPRALLAVLVAAGGRSIPVPTLIEQVWPDNPPPAVGNTLQGYVASLRRTLEPGRAARAAARLVVRDGSGYALLLPPSCVDAGRFEQVANEAHTDLVAGRATAAAAALDRVLSSWRGRPYDDVAEAPFLVAHVARLEQIRATAVADRHAAAIALGEHTAAIAPLAALVEETPLDERLWELLALAQYRAGRQGDALATLRAARRRLADELGIDPGDRLRQLESDVLAQSTALDPEKPAGRLPAPVDELVGRQDELSDVADLMARHRLVTLVGPPGAGKTRLALELARGVPDHTKKLVELGPVRTPGLVAATVARALGMIGVENLETLVAALHGRQALLVMDNCEHLVDETGHVLGALLARCPGIRLLATARQPLGVPGEVIAEVGPLPLPDAMRLFSVRARAVRRSTAEDDRREIRRICEALDGLPLAVEIAAARSRVLPLTALADELGARPAHLRDRSLDAALAWGYGLLDPGQQHLLRTVSAFAGGFTLEAVRDLTGRLPNTADPVTIIGDLTDRSLVVRGSNDRYRLLEPIRAFAQRQQNPAQRFASRRAHLLWMRDLAETAETGMVSGRAGWWTARMSAERDNVRAAFATVRETGDTVTGLRLAGALIWFWYRWGAIEEGGAILAELLAHKGELPDPDGQRVARALLAAAGLRYLAGEVPAAHRLMTEATERAADPITRARCGGYAAHFAVLSGVDPADALDRAETALRLAEHSGPAWVRAEVQTSYGLVLLLTRGPEAAADPLADGLRAAQSSGHDFAASNAAWSLMQAELARDRPAEAAALGAAALRQRLDAGDVTSWMMIAHTMAGALTRMSATEDAAVVSGVLDALTAAVGFDPARLDPAGGERPRSPLHELNPEELTKMLAKYR